MFSASQFHRLVSGQRRGVVASAARGILRAAELPYTLAVSWRNRRYDRGRAKVQRCSVPVISVGNLSLGGTGKTPLVKWIARWAADRRIHPVIVSRGYAARGKQHNDEARELAQALPGIPHVQGADRVAAAQRAIRDFDAQLILLDDGFQHRRLARDLDIVLLDALQPFGFDHVFPRGLLREPLAGLARADVVCLSRADLVDPSERMAVRRRVVHLAPQAAWCEAAHVPSGLIDPDGRFQTLDTLRDRRVAAFCGLGNPAGFRRTLEATGCMVVDWHEFPDHHAFADADVDRIAASICRADAELAVCTHKDLVKIRRDQLAGRPLRALQIEIQFLEGQAALEEKLASSLERGAPAAPH